MRIRVRERELDAIGLMCPLSSYALCVAVKTFASLTQLSNSPGISLGHSRTRTSLSLALLIKLIKLIKYM